MNKKHGIERSNISQSIIFTATFILSLFTFSPVQAQQSVVENPMLPSSPVKYGPYTHTTNSVQVESSTPRTKSSSTRQSPKKEAVGTVNINSATETELVALPGIGPSKARAIAEYRQKQGGFKSIEDLQQVKGIGPATLEKLRAHVTL